MGGYRYSAVGLEVYVAAVWWLVGAGAALFGQRTVYVDAAAGGMSGTTWQDAFTDLHDALAVAQPAIRCGSPGAYTSRTKAPRTGT